MTNKILIVHKNISSAEERIKCSKSVHQKSVIICKVQVKKNII